MSGDIQYDLNNSWLQATRGSYAIRTFFYELYIALRSLDNYEIISYGWAGTNQGTSDPNWYWANKAVDAPPWGSNDNVYIVLRANAASADLLGLSSSEPRPFEFKIQAATAAFDDCSGSNYGNEGTATIVCARLSPDGGWNATSRDFAPTSGSTPSPNMQIMNGNVSDWGFHLVADNDTIIVAVLCNRTPVSWDGYAHITYIGEVKRASSYNTKPEVLIAGSNYLANSKTDLCPYDYLESQAQIYSLAPDGLTSVTGANSQTLFSHLTANEGLWSTDSWSDDIVFSPIIFVQSSPTIKLRCMFGELRMIFTMGDSVATSNRCGENNEWLTVGDTSEVATSGNLVIRWDPETVPAF